MEEISQLNAMIAYLEILGYRLDKMEMLSLQAVNEGLKAILLTSESLKTRQPKNE